MRRRRGGPVSLAFLVCILIIGPSLLAYASPPDPSWVRGVYDDADFDDVVWLIIANVGLIDGAAWMEGRPDFILIWGDVPPDDLSVAPLSPSSSQSRAPPTP